MIKTLSTMIIIIYIEHHITICQVPKLVNTFYIPKYAGVVAGMKSENPFGATFTKLAKKQMDDFDNKRFNRETNETYKEYI